jgi:hypothetical protein
MKFYYDCESFVIVDCLYLSFWILGFLRRLELLEMKSVMSSNINIWLSSANILARYKYRLC